MGEVKWFHAKYAGSCHQCRTHIINGDTCLWRNHRLFCRPCGRTVLARAAVRAEARRDAAVAARRVPNAP